MKMPQENTHNVLKHDNLNIMFNILIQLQHNCDKKPNVNQFNQDQLQPYNKPPMNFLQKKRESDSNPINSRVIVKKQNQHQKNNDYILPTEILSNVISTEKVNYYNIERDRAMTSSKCKDAKCKKNMIIPCLPRFFGNFH